ncbi:hypothetical protein BGZ59_003578, partial [Podila verticillata]
RQQQQQQQQQDKGEQLNPSDRADKTVERKNSTTSDRPEDKDKGVRKEPNPTDRYNEEWRQVMEDRNRAPQQYFIDHLNEEKRRKRRVEDRELQTKSAHQKLVDNSTPTRPKDEPMDVDQDVVLDESSSGAPLLSPEISRPYKSLGNGSSSGGGDTDRKPRFVPGFGPEGLTTAKASISSSSSSSSTPLADVARSRPEAFRSPNRPPTSTPATPRVSDPSWPLARRDDQGSLVSKEST